MNKISAVSGHRYAPREAATQSRFVFALHGLSRLAGYVHDAWLVSADRYGLVVVTPQLDNVAYKGHEFEKMGAAAAALAFAPN